MPVAGTKTPKGSICFVVPASSQFLDPLENQGYVGGAEIQQYHMAKFLVDTGWAVSFLAYEHPYFKGKKDIERDRIRYISCAPPGVGIPRLRFLHPQCTSAFMGLCKADAQIYYQRCPGIMTGLTAFFCRLFHKSFVFAASSDSNFTPDDYRLDTRRDRIAYLYGIKEADAVIVQNKRQLNLLQNYFGLKGYLIPNAWPSGGDGGDVPLNNYKSVIENLCKKNFFLWVGKIRHVKRPDRLVQIAKANPKCRFIIIGNKPLCGTSTYVNRIIDSVREVSNISYLEHIPFSIIHILFQNAVAFVNTSDVEGFPNTFLQAWKAGTPTISIVDPDNIIRRHKLGIVVENTSQFIEAIHTLDISKWQKMGHNSSCYFRKHHTMEHVGRKFEELLFTVRDLKHGVAYNR